MPILTAKMVESFAKPAARVEVTDALVPGLRLVVQPSGVKSWAVRYSFARRKRKMTLGPFPRLSLAEARDAAQKALKVVALGSDPGLAKVTGTPTGETFEAAADLYIKLHVSRLRAGTQAYVRREIETAKEAWRGRPTRSIKRADIIALVDQANESGPHAGNQCRKVLAAFFHFCEDRDLVEVSPARGLKKTRLKARDRFLDDGELRLVWIAADKCGGQYGALAKLLILTGCRRNEIARLEWSEIVGDFIVLPPMRTKTGEPHRVFITPLMRSILDALPKRGQYVLGNGRPMSANMRAKESLDVQLNEPWRFHDLRRSFSTGLQRLGIPVEIIERCLNHKMAGIAAIYNRHDYSAEMRDAFERWSAHIPIDDWQDARDRLRHGDRQPNGPIRRRQQISGTAALLPGSSWPAMICQASGATPPRSRPGC
jgi:integrase